VIYDATLDALLQKVWDGARINPAEALRLYRLPLEELGTLPIGDANWLSATPTIIGATRSSPTLSIAISITRTSVMFTANSAHSNRVEGDDDAYVITHEQIDKKIEETIALRGTQILMQGGHHPKLSLQWYLDLLSHIKRKFPQINIHGFSPSEFIHFREVFGLSLDDIISQFVKAGLGSIPGGGARFWSIACARESLR